MFKAIKNKLYGLDTLRDTAFADKERSKTRLFFTLLIFGGAIAAFVILFIYKATHRSTIVKTENAPDFKKYNKLEDHYSDSLACVSAKTVEFKDVATFDISAAYEQTLSDICSNLYVSPGMLYDGCDDASYSLQTALENYKLQKGTFMSRLDVSLELEALLTENSDDTYGTAWSIWNDIQSAMSALEASGAINPDNQAAFDAWIALVTSALNDDPMDANNNTFSESFYATNSYWYELAYSDVIVLSTEEDDFYEVKMDYEKYFNNAKVVSCTYTVKEGWFDVFIFAMNSTQSLFGASVIVFGFLYSLVKTIQGRCGNKDEEGNDTEMRTK